MRGSLTGTSFAVAISLAGLPALAQTAHGTVRATTRTTTATTTPAATAAVTPTATPAAAPVAAPAPIATQPAAGAPGLTPAQEAEARAHFERGLALFNSQDFNGALAEFQAAYDQSHRASVLYNIGVTHQSLHHYPEAARSIEQYLREATITPDRRRQVDQGLNEIRNFIAHITLAGLPAGAVVTVDGERVGTAPFAAPLAVGTGRHVVDASADGFRDVRETFLIAGGQDREIRLEMRAEALTGGPAQPTNAATTGNIIVRGAPINASIEIDARTARPGAANPVVPGHHTVRVHAPGFRTWAGEMTVVAGSDRTATVHLAADVAAPSRIPVVAAGVVTLGAGLGALFAGIATQNVKSQFDQLTQEDPRAAALSQQGTTLRTATNVLLGVTGLAAIATAGLFIRMQLISAPDSTVDIAFSPRPEGGGEGSIRVRF